MNKIQEAASFQGKDNENLLEMLKEAQSKSGYVTEESIIEISKSLDVPISEVYGVASFYSFLSTSQLGRNVIRICQSLPCHLQDSEMIIKSIEEKLGIKPGETTPDGKFSLELTNCIGACDEAPAMLINSDVHNNLTPGKISEILDSYE